MVEQNIQYVYLSLPTLISDCTSGKNQCSVTEEELHLLDKIQKIIYINYSTADRIQFVSERQNPGFFTTSSLESNRIAKTGLDLNSPIFFNIDEIYDLNGRPNIDFAAIAAFLIHEIGHQTGEKSHAKLDILGAKIRMQLAAKFVSLDYSFSNQKSIIELTIVNYSLPTAIGDVYLTSSTGGSLQLTTIILKKLHCSNSEDNVIGFNINNGHWNHVLDNPSVIEFESWVQVYCRNMRSEQSSLHVNNMGLLVRISMDAEVLSLKLK